SRSPRSRRRDRGDRECAARRTRGDRRRPCRAGRSDPQRKRGNARACSRGDHGSTMKRERPAAEPPPIRIFVTGGTFDKEYDELRGTLYFKQTHLPEMLQLGRSRLDVSIETLMMMDSLDMTDADRQRIVEACRDCEETHIVVTHGTHTMVDTARARAPGVRGKTIGLPGGTGPYALGSSYALSNLGSALSFVQGLPEGVSVATRGRWARWGNGRKHGEAGTFETRRCPAGRRRRARSTIPTLRPELLMASRRS